VKGRRLGINLGVGKGGVLPKEIKGKLMRKGPPLHKKKNKEKLDLQAALDL